MIAKILSLIHDPSFLINKNFQIVFSNKDVARPDLIAGHFCYKKIFSNNTPCSFCTFFNQDALLKKNDSPRLIQLTNQIFNGNQTESLLLTQTELQIENEIFYLEIVHVPDQNTVDLSANDQLITLGAHVQTIAHELSNPVTGLNLTIQKIREIVDRNEEIKTSALKPFLELLSRDIQRASEIVSEIRNYSRPIRKPTKIVDLKTVIENGLKNVQRLYTLQEVKIDFKWNIPDKIKIYGNAGKLEQCFINIFKNCYDMFHVRNIKYEARIIIEAEILNEARKIAIHIIDNAGGISNDALKKVFRPYFTTKERYRGLGLGLYITSKILKEHGGSIQMDSSDDKTKVTIIMQIPD